MLMGLCMGTCAVCRRTLTSQHRLLDSQLEDRARGLTEEHIKQLKAYFAAGGAKEQGNMILTWARTTFY